ncbi:MAG: Rossmann-like and DUF2520 domain-containing protein [Maribacter sp.]
MIKVTLVGTGSVSKHLENVFSKTIGIELLQVIQSRGDTLAESIKNLSKLSPKEQKRYTADVYIIAVSDDVIGLVSKELEKSNSLIVHTSGSIHMDELPSEVRKGVFYPLQTLSKGRKADFKTVPLCIEAEKKEDLELLRELAESISESVYDISCEQRKSLHLAAVFINNFTNHIYQIGNEICEENEVPFEILKPLIKETIEKLDSLSPIEAQTGPAKRNDKKTIDRHLKQLKNKTHKEVYQILTKSIKETYGENL